MAVRIYVWSPQLSCLLDMGVDHRLTGETLLAVHKPFQRLIK